MKRLDIIPAMLFGVILGTVVTLGVRDPHRLPISLIPSLVTAMTTIIVGWWIHTAVRQRGELDRIQIDYMSDLNRRIRDLMAACFSTTGNQCVRNVKRLSIEISHLCEIAHRIQPDLSGLEAELDACYIDFKKHLTDSDAVDMEVASEASSRIRMTALKIQWHLCKRILEHTTDAGVFARRNDHDELGIGS